MPRPCFGSIHSSAPQYCLRSLQVLFIINADAMVSICLLHVCQRSATLSSFQSTLTIDRNSYLYTTRPTIRKTLLDLSEKRFLTCRKNTVIVLCSAKLFFLVRYRHVNLHLFLDHIRILRTDGASLARAF